MHMCYERPGVVTALNGGVGYDKWDRDRGGGGGGGGGAVGVGAGVGGGAPGGAWAGRDREKDRERERQARAHQQMSHAEPDASSLFPAPIRVTGNRDRVSQQIQTKLGDYQVAQFFIDDPSKSIGICAEPPSPAPCPPSRRESEFKKPAHAPQNGRVHHRPYPYNKNDGPSSTGAPAHRPPPLRIANGFQTQSAIESSQPPIESILKEMKSLPTQLSAIAATPRKEAENKFIFNPYTNKVQENPQLTNTDLRSPITKPGLDNRISNSRSSTSPDVVNKDLGLSESDDEVAANSHRLGPPLSPINSGSPSSGSSSQSDSETESSSAASPTPTATVEAPSSVPVAPALTATAPAPAQRPSWGLSNFVPPAALDPTFDSEKDHLRHALADVKDKPSPISDMSDSETSSPSPGVSRRRRSTANRASTASSDEETPRHHTTTSPRVATSAQSAPLKRGRPPKARPSEERPPKKKRGRPPKTRPPSPPALPPRVSPPPMVDSDVEPDPPPTQHHHTSQDNKSQIFRKVFTPRKGDEGGGKGGKGGKGKGGKGKGQVTIIDGTAPELMGDDEDRRHRERSNERRNEEALARVSPPRETESIARRREAERREAERREAERREVERREAERLANERLQERVSIERTVDRPVERSPCSRIPSERTSNDRIPSDKIATERTSNDRIPPDRPPGDRHSDRIPIERLSNDRLSTSDRLSDRHSRLSSERLSTERLTAEKMAHERLSGERHSHDRLPVDKHERSSSDRSHDRLSEGKIGRISDNKLSIDRLPESKLSIDRYAESKLSMDRLAESKTVDSKVSSDRLSEGKMSIERVSESKAAAERLANERYVRAEADLGAGLKPGRGSERLEEASSVSERRSRPRVMVRVPLARLRNELVRALQRPVPVNQPVKRHAPISEPGVDVGATNHERTGLSAEQTPIYYSYFERLPADTLSAEERNHKYYLEEATRLRTAADREQEPLSRVMLLLESVLCFVLTGRVMELEFDTKGAFTIYRQTIAYIKLIHSMPQRFRASPPDTFNKLDILSLRVQALLYLRMFKMYNPEVQEYNKIVHEYQQKPACAESASPLSPSPSPAGSVGSVGSGASASSGYCSSLVHSVPAHAHQALLLLTKYFTFLYVAHELWEQADTLCRLRDNQDLFIAVDRKCGPLSLSSTFRHLVQYVRYAISLLKNAPRE